MIERAAPGRRRCEGARTERRDDGDVRGAQRQPRHHQDARGGGADVNAKERIRATTALMWAAQEGHAAAVKALVELGADVSREIWSRGSSAQLHGAGGQRERRGRERRAPSCRGRKRAGLTRNNWPSNRRMGRPRRMIAPHRRPLSWLRASRHRRRRRQRLA